MTMRRSLLLPMMLLALAGGCAGPQGSGQAIAVDGTPPSRMADDGARRFQDTPLEGRTAVESAIELSEKYARLSDQTVSLREENQRLKTENDGLRQQVASLETRLKQTQKELAEANDLLIEMLTELNNWKNNILGFRGEMRQAAQAQLEALLKVLEILGGEAEAGTLSQRHAATLDPTLNNVAEPNGPSTQRAEDVNGTR